MVAIQEPVPGAVARDEYQGARVSLWSDGLTLWASSRGITMPWAGYKGEDPPRVLQDRGVPSSPPPPLSRDAMGHAWRCLAQIRPLGFAAGKDCLEAEAVLAGPRGNHRGLVVNPHDEPALAGLPLRPGMGISTSI